MSTDNNGFRPDVAFRSNRQVAVHVPDLAKAEAFYSDVLGFKLVNRTDDYLELDTGELQLYVNRDSGDAQSFIPSLDVTDFQAAKRLLETSGCTIVREESRSLYFRDPFGFLIDIVES